VFSELFFYDVYKGVLKVKRGKVERFWPLQSRIEFNQDPSIAHRTFNTALVILEVALSDGHILSDEMTI
jgi:hypothetical protein